MYLTFPLLCNSFTAALPSSTIHRSSPGALLSSSTDLLSSSMLDSKLLLLPVFPAFPVEAPAASHGGWDEVTRLLPSQFGKVTTERRHCSSRLFLRLLPDSSLISCAFFCGHNPNEKGRKSKNKTQLKSCASTASDIVLIRQELFVTLAVTLCYVRIFSRTSLLSGHKTLAIKSIQIRISA